LCQIMTVCDVPLSRMNASTYVLLVEVEIAAVHLAFRFVSINTFVL